VRPEQAIVVLAIEARSGGLLTANHLSAAKAGPLFAMTAVRQRGALRLGAHHAAQVTPAQKARVWLRDQLAVTEETTVHKTVLCSTTQSFLRYKQPVTFVLSAR
jgi:hypothetical protein